MTALVMILDDRKSDVVDALRIKMRLWDSGIVLSGLVLKGEGAEFISPLILEEMMQLKVLGSLVET